MGLKYLSPSAYIAARFYPEQFIARYVLGERDAQTVQMAIGSVFDCMVKDYIERQYLDTTDQLYDKCVAESVPDPIIRSDAYPWAKRCFDGYLLHGLPLLAAEMALSDGKLIMESTMRRTVGGVPLLGKPDLYFTVEGLPVIKDWKCNSIMSKASPKKGFVDSCFITGPKAGVMSGPHDLCQGVVQPIKGLPVYCAAPLNVEWAIQCCFYGWMAGASYGADHSSHESLLTPIIAGIEQLVGWSGDVRLGRHSFIITKDFQRELLADVQRVWAAIQEENWSEIAGPMISAEGTNDRER